MQKQLNIILLEAPDSQRVVGTSSAVTQRGMSLAIINAADKEFGRDAWKTRECASLPGFYAVNAEGQSIVLWPGEVYPN